MARSIAVIQKQIIDAIQADTTLYDPANAEPQKRGLTSTSRVALWRLWVYIQAFAINAFEQLLDIFKVEVEAGVSLAPPGTPKWLQQQVLLFQWSATNDQIIQFSFTTFSPYYPVVNAALRVVTQCAVVTTANKNVLVKVARGGATPIPLSAPQAAALTSYLDYLNFAGVYFTLRNVAADFIMLGYDLYYDGQYSSSIVADVQNAITAYLTTANTDNFNGTTTLSKLEDVIQSVPGIRDVVARQIEVRQSTVLPANATAMVNNYQTLIRSYQPYAGYMIVDTGSGRTLADTLTYFVV